MGPSIGLPRARGGETGLLALALGRGRGVEGLVWASEGVIGESGVRPTREDALYGDFSGLGRREVGVDQSGLRSCLGVEAGARGSPSAPPGFGSSRARTALPSSAWSSMPTPGACRAGALASSLSSRVVSRLGRSVFAPSLASPPPLCVSLLDWRCRRRQCGGGWGRLPVPPEHAVQNPGEEPIDGFLDRADRRRDERV